MMKIGGDAPPRRLRFSEPQKFLPVAFVSLTIFFLFFSYLFYHIFPLLQVDLQDFRKLDPDMRRRGKYELVIFLYLTAMLLICYVRSILVHPGEIPHGDPQWEYSQADGRPGPFYLPPGVQEVKKTGDRRHCKWCGKYKPDRCHHCRVCKSCILKMDHHCPWIYNCVGFSNYKFFFLLLLYCVLDTHFIVWTMSESVQRCAQDPLSVEWPFMTMFITFFTETVAFFLAVLVTMFFGFHIVLMFKAMTTIEHCEKSQPKKEAEAVCSWLEVSTYDLGFCGNIRAVLGDNFLLWFFPCSVPSGDGLNFISDETRLSKDMESGKGIRRRGHQRTQRPAARNVFGQGFGSYYSHGSYSAMP